MQFIEAPPRIFIVMGGGSPPSRHSQLEAGNESNEIYQL
ncbi:hypothetical protein GXM_02161 [Nostoc sphaeroides CCNUC1]|uniref:Uncharacterized protein n=1 Tax=Nostoc sphaeroides CCNUC1 TaxID=2653204 RepID=A0A5P8VX20_9NOSO|nr:hypothetical protein GXM_02161 [Nostoc sphaeroides CCNUC1]